MSFSLFTSESVSQGHPDKIADQISDAVLDACLQQDPDSKVACETLINNRLVILAGEITTQAKVDYKKLVKQVITNIGYGDPLLGFDLEKAQIIVDFNEQSPDIARGVSPPLSEKEQGAGDQGLMFGYACEETPELMPLPIALSHKLIASLTQLRKEKLCDYLRPDAKAQVTVEYDEKNQPISVESIVLSAQHSEQVSQKTIHQDMKQLIKDTIDAYWLRKNPTYHINPTGRFVLGGPAADCGLTGRKIIVDTYGGMSRHGGGCFSGKDPSKVDRSAAYALRYVAKNIVAAKLATRCELQVAYAIGVPYPVSIKVDTFGTEKVPLQYIKEAIFELFNLSPQGIINTLDLKRPIYFKTASLGHFGREDENFPWEKCDRVNDLNQYMKEKLGCSFIKN